MFFVYIIQSLEDQSYYFGITSDPEEPLFRNNPDYENYFRLGKPGKLVWCMPLKSRDKVLSLEKKLIRMKSKGRIRAFIEKKRP